MRRDREESPPGTEKPPVALPRTSARRPNPAPEETPRPMTSRFLYVDADTALHRLHPNTKLLCLVLLFAAVMAFNHPLYEGALVALGVVLLALARSLGNLRRSWKFFALLFVIGSLLWVLFVKDIAEPRIVWELQPFLVERGTVAYDLVIVLVLAGLLALVIVGLSLLQLLVRDMSKQRVGAWWWVAVAVVAAVGVFLAWRGSAVAPRPWVWWLVLAVYFAACSALVAARLKTPYALPLWLGTVFVAVGAHYAIAAFFVHINTPGTHFVWGPHFALSEQALLYGPAMGLRIVAFLCFGLVFISTTSPEEMTQGLRAMGMPLTPSVALSLAFRLVPLFAGTARTVMQAQRARGLDLDAGGPLSRLRHTVPVIVPTLGYALRSADDLTRALETRGLGAAERRTEYRHLAGGARDVAAVALVGLFAALCITARVTLGVGELLPRL